MYEAFEGEIEAAGADDSVKIDPFETKAIFTLADFLKALGPNEFYDVAQKLYLNWEKNQIA